VTVLFNSQLTDSLTSRRESRARSARSWRWVGVEGFRVDGYGGHRPGGRTSCAVAVAVGRTISCTYGKVRVTVSRGVVSDE
jgi:hypothetical protein